MQSLTKGFPNKKSVHGYPSHLGLAAYFGRINFLEVPYSNV